jgi:hypothetical protein
VNLCAWFIQHARTVFGFSVAVIRTDGGGELWGSKKWRDRLVEECNIIVEPTGKDILPAMENVNVPLVFLASRRSSFSA